MNSHWSPVALGQLLTRTTEEVVIQPDQTYRLLTVGWWGKGVVERKVAAGSEIASSKLLRVRSNQFIISRIDARKGANDIISSRYDGSVVTNDFPVYIVECDRLYPHYLKWLAKTRWFIDLCTQS